MGEWRLIPFSEIPMEKMADWQHMNCPRCGLLVCPYGGFGEGVWASVGKYGCYRGCGLVWYADPRSGEFYERTASGLRVAPSPPYRPDSPGIGTDAESSVRAAQRAFPPPLIGE